MVGDDDYSRVADCVRSLIDQASDCSGFKDLLTRLMARPGRVLNQGSPAKWPRYVLGTCRALGGDPTAAVGAAAAVEFIIASADVVDDLVDDEWDGERDLWMRALNASHGLTWLAHRSIVGLVEAFGPERACRIGEIVASEAVRSCSGEDLDILLEREAEVTAEAVQDMTNLKSGSLVAMACQVGAAAATTDPQVHSMVGRFGRHAGVVAQLLNDIGGVLSGSDLRRRKKTLPIAYAIRCAQEEGVAGIIEWYRGRELQVESDERRISAAIRDLGALHYAAVVADVHRREALGVVRELIRVTGRKEVAQMRRLVPAVWSEVMRGGAS